MVIDPEEIEKRQQAKKIGRWLDNLCPESWKYVAKQLLSYPESKEYILKQVEEWDKLYQIRI